MNKKILFLIPARGGSKGLPGKNIKPLAGKPLICYSIDAARTFASDADICVSTDDPSIMECVEACGLKVPFMRTAELASDSAGTYEVLLHALSFYREKGINYDLLVLLQPTSPLRRIESVKEALESYTDDLDMVVSVKHSHAASLICCENADGYLELVLNKSAQNRQSLPAWYEYNGAIYVMRVDSLMEKPISEFSKKKKLVMTDEESVDIDTELDFMLAEAILKKRETQL